MKVTKDWNILKQSYLISAFDRKKVRKAITKSWDKIVIDSTKRQLRTCLFYGLEITEINKEHFTVLLYNPSFYIRRSGYQGFDHIGNIVKRSSTLQPCVPWRSHCLKWNRILNVSNLLCILLGDDILYLKSM